ncbi:site-specific integrase [Synechococcus sp. HJ21-Hayes]|jgi:integrase/recombinase XerD|uniref:tyrosine-type recombinase/integrase n=1 Tax=unclassified Synechococcus TaxID=2626047 RepID=UPI0020CB7F89|nr:MULTISPECIES: site-specific integrase [unclassified Synechococcus]MCP9831847.1 site-specific integrase [Synechococcus sp. JJ3a-Johnson]MCP9852410.1 site-specific integrase [Synechococcus sp. HJ21-Hayes]
MKTNRFGQAAVLSTDQLDRLIAALPGRHHQVLAEVCRRTGCRISEGRQLTWGCVCRGGVTFPKTITKGKLASRTVPATPRLQEIFACWREDWSHLNGRDPAGSDFVFPGRFAGQCLSSRAFMDALELAAMEVGLEGVSSHSFRRSALSAASEAGVPLAALRALSGHQSLSTLQRYLEISQTAKEQAAAAFA